MVFNGGYENLFLARETATQGKPLNGSFNLW